ncbi:hypothetical protein [Streptomyces sp. RerS4]|uniref:hypothetical protein n=1 Tax=Streptomyces sp. RerS4 TaxID=2942449 RepID=UPI00201C7056|nr:hypothetical protein [Streptomyces sp. RerS4]UQX04034.1 hypothetical protein M4D82_28645 [Streptomyces sp. RerS4]
MSETERERPRTTAPGCGSGGVWAALGASLDGLVELRKRRPAGPCPCTRDRSRPVFAPGRPAGDAGGADPAEGRPGGGRSP